MAQLLDTVAFLGSSDFGSPKEVPKLVDLEVFIPANRLQDIAIGNEAVTDECTFGNVPDTSIFTGLDQSIDHRRFIGTGLRESQIWPAIIEDVDQ